MNIGRSAFKLFLAKSGSALLFFVGIMYFTRRVSADELGSFFLFLALLGILSIPADAGMRLALEKRLSEGSAPAETLGSALAFKTVSVGLVCAGVLFARPWLNDYLGADLAGFLAVGVVLQELSYAYIHVLRGELRVEETASIEFVRRLVLVGAGAALVTVGAGVRGIAGGVLLALLVAFLMAYARAQTRIGMPSVARTRSLLAFSKYQTVISIGGRAYQWMDVVIVGLFLTNRHVSAYEVSWQVTLLVLLASTSIATAIFPQISRWDANAATGHIRETVSTAVGAVLFLSIPALVGVALYAAEILRLFFSPAYTFATTVLVVLVVEKQFQAFADVVMGAIRAIDRPDLAARATLLAVSVNLVLTPVLVATVGLVGAAVGTLTSLLSSTSLLTHYLSRHVGIEFPIRLLGWFVAASLLMGVVLTALKAAVPVTSLPVLLAHIGVGVAVYAAASVAIPDVRGEIIGPGLAVIAPSESS